MDLSLSAAHVLSNLAKQLQQFSHEPIAMESGYTLFSLIPQL